MGRKNRRIVEKLSRLPTVEELRGGKNIRVNRNSKNKKYSKNSINTKNSISSKSSSNNSQLAFKKNDDRNNFCYDTHHSIVLAKSNSSSSKECSLNHDIGKPVLRGSIWLATLGIHDGTSVQGGFRPVIVVSNDVCNKFSKTVTVVPLTSIIKRMKIPTHVLIPVTEEMKLVKPTMVMAEQVMTIDKTSLKKYLSRISDMQLMSKIDNAIRVQLEL